jgi:hypothetical protein
LAFGKIKRKVSVKYEESGDSRAASAATALPDGAPPALFFIAFFGVAEYEYLHTSNTTRAAGNEGCRP